MFATRKALVAAVCLLLVVAGCNRKVDTNDFLPSSPAFQQALQIVLAALSVPADGSSTVRIEAQISPDADPDKRTIRFQTTLGSWIDPSTSGDQGQQLDRQADGAGKAAAFLRAAAEPGVAVITVSVVGVDAQGFETVLATVSGEVTFTQVQGALQLTVTPSSTFADGVSTIVAEATITPDSPASWTSISFATDAGVFEDGSQAKVAVPTDANRVARVQLTSVAVESGTLTATIDQFPTISVSELIAFDQRNPNAIVIGTSADVVPADSATEISVFADIEAGLANRDVTFTTTGGTFASTQTTEVVASADASNRATVRLVAGFTIKEVLLKAQITLNDGVTTQSSDKLIEFVRSAPDFIELSLSDTPPFSQAVTTEVTVTATMTRDIGFVSPNTVVSYTVTLTDGTPVTDMEFSGVTRSADDGTGAQASTAVLSWGSADVSGSPVVVVTATAGGVSGSTSFQITP